MKFLHRIFDPFLNFSLRHKIAVVSVSASLFIGSIFLFNSLGGEFIPTLEEGDLAAGVITLQGGSLSNSIEIVEKANKILMEKFPEIEHVVCKIGTGEIPTDPTPMETGDYIIVMKDKEEWTSASSREEMMEKMEEELSVLKGVVFTLQQPIQMRFNELMTGSKQDVAVKIFGDNLDTLAAKGEEVEKIIRGIEGVEDINVEKVTGSGQVQVNYNRKKIAQYGLNIEQINRLLKTAFAGSSAGVVYDEEKRFDLVVRFNKDFRDDIEYIKNLYIPLPNGNQITLDQVADVQIKTGISQVSRESTKRRITVQFNVRNRDVQSIIEEIKVKLDDKLSLPPGYYITYGGQFENLVNANKRLAVAVPVALLLIFLLLFFTFNSLKQTLLIYSAVPLSMIGGVVALFLRDMNFSISAGIGFIALFGVAVLNGIVLIAEFNRLEKDDGVTDIYERVRQGIKARFRPVLMTAAVASLGFLPMALSTSAGAEVQKPLATVVIGGLITATLLTLVVLPVLYILFSGKGKSKKKSLPKIVTILILALGLNFITYTESSAQNTKPYTLDQAVQTALANNGSIKSAGLNVEYQKKLKAASWQYEKTSFDYSYGQTNSFIKDNGFTISQSYPSVFQNIGRSKLADAYVKSAEYNVVFSETEIVSMVKSVYFQLLYNYSLLGLLNYQDTLYTEFLKAATLKNTTGDSPLLEKVTAETRLLEIQTMIKQVKSDILIYKQKLQVLMNDPNPIEIADTALYKIDFSFVLDTSAINANPALAIMKQQIDISKRETQVEKLSLMPYLSVSYFNQTNKDLDNAYRFTGLQVGISVPLLFFSQSAKVKAGKINELISQNNYDYYLTTLKGEYNTLLQEYLKFKTSLDYYESGANKQSELIIEQSQKSYKAGSIDYVEYVLNLDKALAIKSNYLQTLSLYNESIIAIDKLLGKTK